MGDIPKEAEIRGKNEIIVMLRSVLWCAMVCYGVLRIPGIPRLLSITGTIRCYGGESVESGSKESYLAIVAISLEGKNGPSR